MAKTEEEMLQTFRRVREAARRRRAQQILNQFREDVGAKPPEPTVHFLEFACPHCDRRVHAERHVGLGRMWCATCDCELGPWKLAG